MPLPFGLKYGISASHSLTNIYQFYGGDYMSELNKQLSEQLIEALAGLPDDVKAALQQKWTDEAIGAKKVCDMIQPG
jgi:hypothetical protein